MFSQSEIFKHWIDKSRFDNNYGTNQIYFWIINTIKRRRKNLHSILDQSHKTKQAFGNYSKGLVEVSTEVKFSISHDMGF